jgi:DNA-binding NarL/FixJ family response regulator
MLKDIPASELLDTICRVHAGESIVQPSLATRLITAFSQHRAAPNVSIEYEPLSARELEVLQLLAEGLNNKEIAARLVLTEGTVKNYVSVILDKLHAGNRTHATTIARKHGLVN